MSQDTLLRFPEVEEKTQKSCHDIREVKRYVNSVGHEVLEFVQVFGKNPESPLVKGVAIIQVGVMSASGQRMPPQNVRLEWAYPEGTSVKKAFDGFEEAAHVEIQRWQKEQQERAKAAQVVGARAMPSLLGADGKAVRA